MDELVTRGLAFIERCDRLFDGKREDGSPSSLPADREFAYQQMRQFSRELLSQLASLGTHLGDNDLVGGHDAEDTGRTLERHPESTDVDAEQRGEAPVPLLRSQERDEPGGRRVLPLDSMPVVRLAYAAAGDVSDLPPFVCPLCTKDLEVDGWCFECRKQRILPSTMERLRDTR